MTKTDDPSNDRAVQAGPPKHFAIAFILGAIAIAIAIGVAVWFKRYLEPAKIDPAPAKSSVTAPK